MTSVAQNSKHPLAVKTEHIRCCRFSSSTGGLGRQFWIFFSQRRAERYFLRPNDPLWHSDGRKSENKSSLSPSVLLHMSLSNWSLLKPERLPHVSFIYVCLCHFRRSLREEALVNSLPWSFVNCLMSYLQLGSRCWCITVCMQTSGPLTMTIIWAARRDVRKYQHLSVLVCLLHLWKPVQPFKPPGRGMF